ncbi:efflux RND transporter permease subunit [Sulfitobacter sp. D35]|uniref:efflux RND transporter permease subunit n=1 Tax=Sulfitobacter sp. D35 TaxID=3083252 RepID=UPI00296F89FF|nr:efflux RND transporter permease subunit [Sulfitobacter sp. D35]MDW4499342.1 efflux RND transporter permease subunit [Sulfitobacter sp. D35]
MSALTRFGLSYSRLTILVSILLIAVGVSSYLNFPKREDPAITVRTAIVTAANEGLTLAQLEELVALPLEEAARAVPGVSEVRTQLTGGAAILQVDLADEVPEEDLKRVFDEIRDDMDGLARTLPEGTLGPIVNSDFGDVAVATIAVTGEGFALPEVEDAAKALRDRLYALDAVAAVTLYGQQDEVVTLQIDRARQAAIGTTLNQVIAAVRDQNVRLPSGSVVSGTARVPLDTSGDLAGVEDIRDLLIELPDQGLVRLGDLVTVTRGLSDPPVRPVFQDGRPAIVLAVEMQDGEDITDVGPQLKETVAAFLAGQPIGIDATFSTFQPEIVEDSVYGALLNMAQTFAVVLIVMLFFLGWREALVVAAIVPLAVSFAFGLMGPFGVELQQVSIAAIIISLGLLVDNGVVIVEDMQRRIGEGAARADAAIEAGRQYVVPLAIASVTTVAAFLPLFLLIGTEGEYGYSLGVVVMLMLTGSFLSALYILPRIAVWIIPEPEAEPKPTVFDRVADRYAALVRRVIAWPLVSAGLVLLVIGFGASRMPGVPQQLFPLSERAQILAYLDMPKGTDISETRDTALAFSDWLTGAENPEVTGVTTYVGAGGPRFVLSLDPADVDPASAFLLISTSSFETSSAVLDRARAHVAARVPDAQVRLKRLAMGGREPRVDVELSGPDPDRLLAAAYDVEVAFAEVPGLIQNRNDWGAKRLTGRIDIAQDRVRPYDLTSRDISDLLEGFFDGRQISTLRDGERLVPILLRGAPEDRQDYSAIANAAFSADGQVLSIDQLADLQPRLEFSTLRRIDQMPTVTVSAISETMPSAALLEHVRPALNRIAEDLGPGYDLGIGGEPENSAEVRTKLGGGFPIAIMVMLIALMVQFDSFRRVGITALSVPLVIAGVPLALLAAGKPLSFFGILGLIALSGIVINNAIVLIDQIDIERQDKGLDDAIVEAARKRFRPILLTSLTTVIGLAPMAVAGGALWEPMATLMMGGLGGASILALVWVPALYRLAFRRAGSTVSDSPKAATA